MADRPRHEAKPKPKRKGSGGGGGGSNTWFYLLLAILLGGLLWVAWPYFGGTTSTGARKPVDREAQLREMTRHPDAEVLNPEGEGSKKN